MPLSNARLAYQDCFDIFDAALNDEKGARVEMPDVEQATFLRMRLHNARKIDRKDNTEVYSEGDPMYGQSIYDKLTVRIREVGGKIWLYVEQIALIGKIEGLSSQPEPQPEYDAVEKSIRRI